MELQIQPLQKMHWPEIAAIYQHGMDSGHATFESEVPENWDAWADSHIGGCMLGCFENDTLCGWTALSPVSDRCTYGGVSEISVYVDPGHQRRGIADMLMQTIISESEQKNIWTIQAGIFPENVASIYLHLKHGFRRIGLREKLGKMTYGPLAGKWRDVVLLERRSAKTGVE